MKNRYISSKHLKIPIYFHDNKDGKKVYDFEEMTRVFKIELLRLQDAGVNKEIK